MSMRRILPALCAVVALAAAGCGSSNSSSTSSGSSSGSASTAAASSSGGGVAVKVRQKVTWTNEDSVDHNVTSQSGETIKSDNFGKGATFSFTPTKAGTIS